MGKNGKKAKAAGKEGMGGFAFFLAYIGAAVYFVQSNEGFWGFVLGLLEAAVWPAYLIYHIFELLQI